MVTSIAGKPCMLKCHIGQRPGNYRERTARSMLMGRQIDPGWQLPGQINDSLLSLTKEQNPAYRFVAIELHDASHS